MSSVGIRISVVPPGVSNSFVTAFEWTLSLTSLHPKQQQNSINFHKTSFCGVKAHHCVPAVAAVVVMHSSAHLSGFVEMLRESDFYTNYSCTSVDTVTFGKHQQHHSSLESGPYPVVDTFLFLSYVSVYYSVWHQE